MINRSHVTEMVLLTYGRSDSQGDAVPALLDEVDDVAVVEGVDVHVVHCEDPVPHLQTAATFRRRTWNVFVVFKEVGNLEYVAFN